MKIRPIETFVFFDTETTGLITETQVPAVTELCMIAVKRRHLLESNADEDLRMQHKLLMCFRPYQEMADEAVILSGLDEQLLDQEARKHHSKNVFNTINSFIKRLQPPVCLIAHNGFLFHFPIVRHYFNAADFHLPSNVKCSDSLLAFYDLLEAKTGVSVHSTGGKRFSQLVRDPYHAPNPHPPESYALKRIFERIINDSQLDPKTSEHQRIMMMKLA